MSRRVRLIAALVIPIVGIAALIVRGEVRTSGDSSWQVPIVGFDPRDLLSGQYLRYRYQWMGEGPSAGDVCTRDSPDCCLCLTGRVPGRAAVPDVGLIECADQMAQAGCDDVVVHDLVHGPQRFYIDERFAKAAEAALRDRPAAVDLVVTPEGGVAVRELLIDGMPWREALDRPLDAEVESAPVDPPPE